MNPISRILALALVALTLALIAAPSHAQTSIRQPYIVTFALEPERALTVTEVEAEDISATLAWQVRNLSTEHQLVLERYQAEGWVLLPPPSRQLLPRDSFTTIVRHTGSFAPPTYRLSIVETTTGTVLDTRTVGLDYTVGPVPPRIDAFTTDISALATDAFAPVATIGVEWVVRGRTPTSNLVFEQVLASGDVVSVELPRAFAWVPSVGTGMVAVQAVAEGAMVQLRLRVVDISDDRVLSEREIRIPVGEVSATTPVINSFRAAPESVGREGEVAVSWSVSGAELVEVGLVSAIGQFVRTNEDLPLAGSQTFNALPDSFYVQEFYIYAGDADGNGITQRVAVNITCPYTFFMPFTITSAACPLDDVREFPGAYQLFDRGEMLWRSDRNTILVLFNDGTYARFEDTYVEGEELVYPESALTAELGSENRLPIRGFGKVWAQNPSVRAGLGFAIGTEIGYGMMGQDVAAGNLDRDFSVAYLTLPDSSIVELAEDGTWSKPGEQ